MYMILKIYRGTFNTAKRDSRFLHNNNTEKNLTYNFNIT